MSGSGPVRLMPGGPELRRWEMPALGERPPEPPAHSEDVEEALPSPPSLEEIEAIQRAAHEEGYAAGHAEGLAQAQAEMRRLQARIEGILDAFSKPLSELEGEVERALVELATRVAGSLVRHAYALQPELVAKLAREAIDSLGDRPRSVELRLHPEDLDAVEPLLKCPPGTRLVADSALARGDLRVHAEDVRLDARLSTRLDQLLPRLLAQPGAADSDDIDTGTPP